VASRVTVLRAGLGLAAGWLLLFEGCSTSVFLLLVVATALDGLDGLLARRFGQRTHLGALLDPIADKAVMTMLFGAMAVHGHSPVLWSLFLLGAARDLMVTVRRLSVYRVTGKTLGAEGLGKFKTLVQSLGASGVVFYACFVDRGFSFSSPPVVALFAVVVILSFASWGRYAAANCAGNAQTDSDRTLTGRAR
jgi:cardiolipin synthase